MLFNTLRLLIGKNFKLFPAPEDEEVIDDKIDAIIDDLDYELESRNAGIIVNNIKLLIHDFHGDPKDDEEKSYDKDLFNLLSGYLRTAQNTFESPNNPFQIIPELAMHQIVNYVWNPEYFDNICTECVEISDDKLVLTKKSVDKDIEWKNSNFGKFVIRTNPESIIHQKHVNIIFKWKFRINYTEDSYFIIGISSHNTPSISSLWNTNSYGFCGYESFDKPKAVSIIEDEYDDEGCRIEENLNYGTILQVNDIVEMKFDTKKRCLSFSINGKDQGIAVKDIEYGWDIDYRMVVTMRDAMDEIQLLQFEAEYV